MLSSTSAECMQGCEALAMNQAGDPCWRKFLKPVIRNRISEAIERVKSQDEHFL
jgi:hypothetical protein